MSVKVFAVMIALITGLVLLSVLGPFGTSQSLQRRSAKPIIGTVPDADFGCGCYLYRNRSDDRNRRYIFVGPMDEPGYLNIDGETIRLKFMGRSKAGRNERVGDRSWERYSAGDVTARIDYSPRSAIPTMKTVSRRATQCG